MKVCYNLKAVNQKSGLQYQLGIYKFNIWFIESSLKDQGFAYSSFIVETLKVETDPIEEEEGEKSCPFFSQTTFWELNF
jgi:hypothetical protein